MAANIYPDSVAVGQVETFRVLSTHPGQTFALATSDPAAHVTPLAGSGGTRFTFFSDVAGDYTVTATGNMGDTAQLFLHVAELPSDVVEMERGLARAVREILAGVPHIGPVYPVERYPESGEEDLALTTVPDPVADAIRLTNYCEIGIPTVGLQEYSGEKCVRFTFRYPLSYTLGVKDLWAKDGFPYTSSGEMFIALFLLAMRALAQKRRLGFVNVWCELLQQENVGTLTNEEGEALSHFADWSLIITVTRPL